MHRDQERKKVGVGVKGRGGGGFGKPILYCILVSTKTIFLEKEIFDNFFRYFADPAEEEKLGKKGAEEWLEDTTRLTYNCAHLRSTKENLTDSVKKKFFKKFFV